MEHSKRFAYCIVILAGIFATACGSASGTYEIALQKYLRFNYTLSNPTCTGPSGGRNPCSDIRICTFAAASIAMGGWPTACGSVGKGVPKVCCGLPLVLGPSLIKKVDEEKARNRRCGTVLFESNLSEIEKKFFEIKNSLPEIDTSEPEKFDPPIGGTNTATLHIVDNLPIVSHRECRMAYRQVGVDQLPVGLTEDFICAGDNEGGRDACQQDSGGPLMYKSNSRNLPDHDSSVPYVLVGVVSFGFLCGERGFPGVYTRVSSHMRWITNTMNQ